MYVNDKVLLADPQSSVLQFLNDAAIRGMFTSSETFYQFKFKMPK